MQTQREAQKQLRRAYEHGRVFAVASQGAPLEGALAGQTGPSCVEFSGPIPCVPLPLVAGPMPGPGPASGNVSTPLPLTPDSFGPASKTIPPPVVDPWFPVGGALPTARDRGPESDECMHSGSVQSAMSGGRSSSLQPIAKTDVATTAAKLNTVAFTRQMFDRARSSGSGLSSARGGERER